MKQEGNILIVDDDEDILVAGKLLLKRHFTQIQICNRPENIPKLLNEYTFDAILLDMNFGPGESSGKQGYFWLEEILKIDPQAVVIMITAHGGINVAVDAMKLGATDFIAKPWQNEKVVATLSSAVQLGRTRTEAKDLRSTNKELAQASGKLSGQQLLGSSQAMANVLSLIKRTAPTDANVLILGENGTGKELVARELHCQSLRSNAVFMSVDLGSISETLFESELFGHKKGAFTGATEDRVGKILAAEGGTLFLDEIGNLPLHLQAKLLTVIEQRVVTPLGTNKSIPFNVRIISATNISKRHLCQEEKFRQDLLFRLNTVEIDIPPLRQRSEDIEQIATYYIKLYCKKYGKNEKSISTDALRSIIDYSWPGNIRALRHAVERAIILSEGNELIALDFQLVEQPHQAGAVVPPPEANLFQNPDTSEQDLNLDRIEKAAIGQALKKHRYNISHAAKELGLTRAALYRRMEKHGF